MIEIHGTLKQILVKAGKSHDVQFEFRLTDADIVQLLAWRTSGMVLHIEPEAVQLPLTERTEKGEHKDPFENARTFLIDGDEYPILTGDDEIEYRLTGRELRGLVRLEDVDPFYVLPEGGFPTRVAPFELVVITPGLQFRTVLELSEVPSETEALTSAVGAEKIPQ